MRPPLVTFYFVLFVCLPSGSCKRYIFRSGTFHLFTTVTRVLPKSN
jgi:hypothetical protein